MLIIEKQQRKRSGARESTTDEPKGASIIIASAGAVNEADTAAQTWHLFASSPDFVALAPQSVALSDESVVLSDESVTLSGDMVVLSRDMAALFGLATTVRA